VIGILEVALVALAPIAAAVADDDTAETPHQQIVEPPRLGTFLEGDVPGSAHAGEELQQRRGFGGQDRTGEDAPAVLPDGGDGGCLMDVETHKFQGACHESRSWLRSMAGGGRLQDRCTGRALKMG
jgi:hypothetical protein